MSFDVMKPRKPSKVTDSALRQRACNACADKLLPSKAEHFGWWAEDNRKCQVCGTPVNLGHIIRLKAPGVKVLNA